MSDRHAVLEETLGALRQAADRLDATHQSVAPDFPLTAARVSELPQPEQERLDAYGDYGDSIFGDYGDSIFNYAPR